MPLTDNERDIKNISETAQTEREDTREAKPDTISQATVSANNKRIAKNAIMLYLRMFLSMIVGLYTSRVVLDTLGVEDYGTYNVVGGVVAMLGFLNASMSGATSRFMAFELGSKIIIPALMRGESYGKIMSFYGLEGIWRCKTARLATDGLSTACKA